jgi:ribosomal protein L18
VNWGEISSSVHKVREREREKRADFVHTHERENDKERERDAKCSKRIPKSVRVEKRDTRIKHKEREREKREQKMTASPSSTSTKQLAHRLQVFFSNRHVVGRVIRPSDGHIVASASTLEERIKKRWGGGGREEGGRGGQEEQQQQQQQQHEEKEDNTATTSTTSDDSERRARTTTWTSVSTSDKRACKRIGQLLAERLKKIQLDAINFPGVNANGNKNDEKYSGRTGKRSSFAPKRRRFGGKLETLLTSLRENGVEVR